MHASRLTKGRADSTRIEEFRVGSPQERRSPNRRASKGAEMTFDLQGWVLLQPLPDDLDLVGNDAPSAPTRKF